MKKRKLPIIILLILIVAVSVSVVTAIADFGDFGGSSDYGGSSDSGSSWSSSDSSWGDSSSGGGGASIGVIVAIFFGVVIVVSIANKGKSGTPVASQPAGAKPIDAFMLSSMASYRQRDPNFSEPALIEKISNLYIQMQNCWTAKNLEPLQPYFTDTSYAQFDRQLDSYRRNQRTNYVERITVLGVTMRGWYEEENNDCMVATVRTRIVDYTKDDKTGAIISGSSTAEKFMTYEYVLVRSSGYVTDIQERDAETINCPNCSAPLNINFSAKCPFCSSVVTRKEYDWVISSIKGISQQTQ